jgi:uncharacterized repeat protein (TIGR01451 family)
MLRTYRLRFVLLLILLAPLLATPVWGAPGPFGKSNPEDGDTALPLLLTLSWEDSVGAVRYEYCYDMIDDDACEDDGWITPDTVVLPLDDLTYNTTYYWQVRAIDSDEGITYADGGDWWSFTTQNPALAVDKALTAQSTTTIALGTVLTYTITATNTGDVTLSNVVVSDTLITPVTEHCGVMTLGATCALTGSYIVQESDFMAGEIVNTATATANAPNGDPLDPVTDTVTTWLVAAPPVANPDQSSGNPIGQAVTVDVLVNDIQGDLPIDPTSVAIVNPPPGSTMLLDKFLEVPGEGYWVVNPTTGAITFTPEAGFTGNPTPITYTVDDIRGNTSNAAMVTVTYTEPPIANDDASLGNAVGSAVTVDVLENDEAAEDRMLVPASVVIVGAPSDGKELVVAGEGVWTVDLVSGVITFTPEVGFEGNPVAIQYTVEDDQGNVSNVATVVVTYTANPLARDDTSLGNAVGSTVTVAVLENDIAAPDRDLDRTSVVIVGAPDDGKELVVAGEGAWTVDAITGTITFTPGEGLVDNPTPISYTVADDQGNVSNAATVTVTYTIPPIANDDVSLGNAVGNAVMVDVLANDEMTDRPLDPASVRIVGTENPGGSLVVPGQGAWSVYTVTGAITFTPEAGLEGNPVPIAYRVADNQGNISNAATVTVTYAEIDDRSFVYLPLVLNYWPPIPAVPVLDAIDNSNGDDEYIVSWSSAKLATFYILQESPDSSFTDAVQVYSDTNTSTLLSGKGPTRYYYRVLARNNYGDSGWSNVRSVDVLWEKEPNDNALTQANGPLISGLTYYGRFPSGADQQDYFFIQLQSAQRVELWLRNIPAGQDYDLTLRDTTLGVVGHSGELGNANEYIRTGTLPAGWYYIQVYNRSGGGSTQAYHLRVVYPATALTAAEANAPPTPALRLSNSPPVP